MTGFGTPPSAGGTVVTLDGVEVDTLDINTDVDPTDIGAVATTDPRLGPQAPPVKSGQFYGPPGAHTTSSRPNGFMTLAPIWLPACTVDRLGIEVTTAVASSFFRLGIYADSSGFPGARVIDGGQVDSSSTGVKTLTISQALTGGRYWIAVAVQGTGSPTARGLTSGQQIPGAPCTDGGGNIGLGWSVQSITAALPADGTGCVPADVVFVSTVRIA